MISLNCKKTTTGLTAHLALVRGMKALAELVGTTLGPQGRHVMLAHRAGLAPHVSKDGVEVARHLSLPDSEEELGVRLLRNAAVAVSESFGDGTSTATVFTADLAVRALKLIGAGADTLEVRRGLGLAAYAALVALNDMARRADRGMLTAVAQTAANGDRRVADLLVEAFERVGAEGTIEVEMGNSVEDVLEVAQGSYFDTVPLVTALLPPTGQVEFARPLILFHCDAIETADEILPALELARSSRRPLLILADSVGIDVETLLVRNQNEGTLAVAVVRAPMYGDTRREALLDLTSKFGGTAFGREGFVEFALRSLGSLSEGDLGQADEAILEADGVTLRGAGNNPSALEDRIALVRAELDRGDVSVGDSPSAKLDYIEKRKERLKLLAAGSAKLHIGGPTDVEIKTRLPLAENAHRALLAAAKSGVLPGGGVAMIRAAEKVQQEMGRLEGDVASGASIFLQSLDTPIRWIARNAGLRPDEVLARTLANESDFYGLNAMTGRYGDLAEDGVLDALDMVTDVIRVAVSVVGSMLGVGALVTRASPKPAPERFKGTERVHDKLMREGGFDE
ncbi:chaperonin GroEL [Thauera butanivorans]|uniref:60 kDa chaperonin n=1 Tax=Thauera butanivorans TaxID=86174 RepID=A7MAQ7_9RHOO|nr:chaperonin GroEL [Thauera butanivorans]ABU68845.2 BmoG [Thauera butanivorans]